MGKGRDMNRCRDTRWRVALLLVALMFSATLAAAQPEDPQQVIRTASTQLLEALAAEKAAGTANLHNIRVLVNTHMMPHVDFRRMSSWIMGKYWRRATPEQRERFMREFRDVLMRTYAAALPEYTDVKFEYLAMRPSDKPDQSVVRTAIMRPGVPPVHVDFVMRRRDAGWQIVDVVIEGISMVMNYRSSFKQIMREHGIDGLIDRLADRSGSAASSSIVTISETK